MNATPEMPDLVYEVSDADFELAVLDRSIDVPVLLDCWAPWCGPCRSLTPVLEGLASAYGGRFVLAKLNTDASPQVAAAMGIRSIPQVTLFIGGRPVDQFMGALPEGQVRAFLDRHLPAADELPAQAEAEPEPDPLDDVQALLDNGELEQAGRLLAMLPPETHDERHAKLAARLELLSRRPEGDPAALQARIAVNTKDYEARFQLAALRAFEGNFYGAFEQLLEVVLRDKGEAREKARLQLVEWFEVCPDPDVVSQGRRYLGMYLN